MSAAVYAALPRAARELRDAAAGANGAAVFYPILRDGATPIADTTARAAITVVPTAVAPIAVAPPVVLPPLDAPTPVTPLPPAAVAPPAGGALGVGVDTVFEPSKISKRQTTHRTQLAYRYKYR